MKITRTALIVFGFSIHWYGVLIAMGVNLLFPRERVVRWMDRIHLPHRVESGE